MDNMKDRNTSPERPYDVRFENGGTDLGIGTSRPRISWRPGRGDTGEYEVRAWSEEGEEWTATAAAGEHRFLPWVGPALTSRERRHVSVRSRGGQGDWSDPATVEAGLLEAEDWRASFVGPADSAAPAAVLRKVFTAPEGTSAARAYVAFRGIGVVVLNGEQIGDAVLAPGWSSYGHRTLVSTIDLTGMLCGGENTLEIRLGNGWFRGRLGFFGQRAVYGRELAALVQVEMNTERGRTDLVSDASWVWTPGPVLAGDLYDGETYDARRETDAANTAWEPVLVHDGGLDTLEAPTAPPVRRTGEVAARRVFRSPSGKVLVDFGQNLVGWVRIRVSGERGTTIVIRHAEELDAGELGVVALRSAQATDRYLLRGGGEEVWEPSFTFHGFRYVEIEGWPCGEPRLDDITAIIVHTDLQRLGTFTTSHRELARLHENSVWSTRGNIVSLPTDCPQRDERLGWTGDIAVYAPTASFLYDCAPLLRSWLRDLSLEQHDDGTVPFYVPSIPTPQEYEHIPLFHIAATAVWGDAATLVPVAVYQATGDPQVLVDQYDSMVGWVEKVRSLAGEELVWDTGFQFGDWLDPTAPEDDASAGATEPSLIATAYFAQSARLVARAARIIGRPAAEAERYQALAENVKRAFNARFVGADGRMSSDAQTAYAVALQLDLLPSQEERDAAGVRLVQLVRAGDHAIATGFVGTPLILDALTAVGAIDDAYRMLLRREFPSWLYPVTRGATTIWERWDSLLPGGRINPNGMTSFNHYALGAVSSWLHSTVGGLSSLEPGWTRIRIAPRPHASVRDAKVSHLTPSGPAAVSWVLDAADTLTVQFDVPPTVTAVLDLGDGTTSEYGPGSHTVSTQWNL